MNVKVILKVSFPQQRRNWGQNFSSCCWNSFATVYFTYHQLSLFICIVILIDSKVCKLTCNFFLILKGFIFINVFNDKEKKLLFVLQTD